MTKRFLADVAFDAAVEVPTQSPGDNSTQAASTAYVETAVAGHVFTTLNVDQTISVGANAATGTLSYILNSAAGWVREIEIQTASSSRWTIACTDDAESGSNAGSSFQINRYDDAGTYLSQPINIDRATGIVGLGDGVNIQGGSINNTTIGGTSPAAGGFASLQVGTDISSGPVTATLNGAVTSARYLLFQTTSTNRWRFGCDDSAESGANAGSNFYINAYDDAGLFLSQPISIARDTGVVTFAASFTVPTASVGENSGIVASTAFVIGQAGTSDPIVDGTAAAGTSTRLSREDHVHPTDTSRAPLASPALTSTPTAPTAAVDTNTTQIATTAFVIAQASSATPLIDGTAAVGTATTFARGNHVHPTDTTRAPLASPTFTGSVVIPGGTIDNATVGATTATTGRFTTITSTQATGTAPFTVASTTNVTNLNASSLNGATFAAPGTIGGTTPAAITGTTIVGSTSVQSGTNSAAGTTIVNGQAGAARLLRIQTASTNRWALQADTTAEGGSNAGSNFALTAYDDSGTLLWTPISIVRSTGLITMNKGAAITGGSINNATVGATTASTGAFSTLSASSTVSGSGFTTLLSSYATLASPTFTGTVTIPSGASISGFATLASPTLTGTPAAPTAASGTNTTQVATTAFVQAATIGGASQAYSDVTGTRTLATNFTNSTGRAIYISAWGTSTSASNLYITVGGSIVIEGTGAAAGTAIGVAGAIPPGATYQIVCAAGTPTLSKWWELR
jgi:hypothetical protein